MNWNSYYSTIAPITPIGSSNGGCQVYDFRLDLNKSPNANSQCITDITFECHPLVVGKYNSLLWQTRLPAYDVESVSLLLNGDICETITNYDRETPAMHPESILPVYRTPLDFNKCNLLCTKLGNYTIRVIFWRQPVSPFWINYKSSFF
jgi:hypothetical protein